MRLLGNMQSAGNRRNAHTIYDDLSHTLHQWQEAIYGHMTSFGRARLARYDCCPYRLIAWRMDIINICKEFAQVGPRMRVGIWALPFVLSRFFQIPAKYLWFEKSHSLVIRRNPNSQITDDFLCKSTRLLTFRRVARALRIVRCEMTHPCLAFLRSLIIRQIT